MKMPDAWLGEDNQSMPTLTEVMPPRSRLWGSVRALSGVPSTHAVARMKVQHGSTEWRAAWVTDSLIGFVSMSKGQETWSAYSEETRPDECTAWARPLSAVVSTHLERVDSRQVRSRATGERVWL